MDTEKLDLPEPPTALARRYVQYVVGFGIAVGIGLAPFLGKVVGIDALLNLFPRKLHFSLIPFSSFLMGLMAAGIQFYSGETLRPALLRKRFRLVWLLLVISLFLLFVLYSWVMVPVTSQDAKATLPFIVGEPRIHGGTCTCPDDSTDAECIKFLSFDDADFGKCWDPRSIRLRTLLLSLNYLAVTGGFGGLIGLLLLQEEARKKQKRRPRKAAAPDPPASAPPQGASGTS